MKPIVIYLDKHDDEIKLTKKEFEEYINKAYDQGYACGYAEGKKYYPWWGNGGITYTGDNIRPLDIKYTGKEYNPDYIQITCDTDRNIVNSNTFKNGDTTVTIDCVGYKQKENE